MEGIMMRHKDKYSIAVRRPDNEIELKVEDYKCVFGNAKFLKYPLIRGVVSFVDSLVVGTKCLMYSAEIAGDEEDEEDKQKNAALSEEELAAKKAKEDKQFKWLLYVTVAISIICCRERGSSGRLYVAAIRSCKSLQKGWRFGICSYNS